MKKLLSILLLGIVSLTASAQYQVANSNFEQWESVSGGEEPVHWSSFLTASGTMAGSVKEEQLYKSTNKRPGSTGSYSAMIKARSVLGIAVAQGNMTTGQINGGSMSATDANGNYNWTNTSDANFNMPFTGYPDAIRVWINFYASNSAHTGKISAYLHGNGYYQDPNTGNTGQLVQLMAGAQAKPARTATSNTYSASNWQQVTVPFEYVAGVNARPSYALVSFATNSTPGEGTAGDWMYIDDMELLYYSELATATYNGVDINITNGTASVDGGYNEKLVKFKSNGHGAVIEQNFNESTYLLTVTVKADNFSEDPTNYHTYTIQFTGIASGDDDQSSAVVVPETTLTNNVIQTGAFYLKNVATGTYLGNNNALSATPHKWNITGSGTYKFIDDSNKAMQLTRKSSNSSFSASNFNVFSNASSSNATEFTTAAQNDGSYQLYSYIKYYNGVFSLGAKSDNIYYAATNANALTCQIQGSTNDYSKWALIDPMQYIRVNEFWPNYASASLTNGVEAKGFITAGKAQTVSGLPLGVYGFAGEENFYLPFNQDLTITAAQSNKTLTYYGRLDLSLHATYNGVTIQGGSTMDAVYEASKLTVNLTGNGAQEYATSFDEETYVLTIMVSGYGRMNEYEIQFAAPSMTLSAQWYGEDIEDGAVINEEYNEEKLILTPGRGTSVVRSFDTTTGVLTVTQTSVYDETKEYTYKFALYPAVVSSKTYNTGSKKFESCDGVDFSGTKSNVVIQTLENGNINFILAGFYTNNAAGVSTYLGRLTAYDIKVDDNGNFSFSGKVRSPKLETMLPLTINAQLLNGELYAAVTIYNDEVLTYYSYGITNVGSAITYTDDIYVTINGDDAGHQQSTVTVNHLSNGNVNFTLNDFELGGIGKVGTIAMKNLPFDATTGEFVYTGTLFITPGTTGSASEWMGPSLGAIPVVLRGQITSNTMALVIDIDFREQMDQVIHVTFGCVPTSSETFTDKLVVNINGESTTPQDATVQVGHLQNGNINFTLNNFELNGVGAVGNISIENIQFNAADGTFAYEGTVFIGKGNKAGVTEWLGPSLGIVPLDMKGQIYTYNNTRYLIVTIDIDMQEQLGQTIHVTYGAIPVSTETYTDDLVVTINGVSTTKPNTVITVGHLKNGNINFTLADFTLNGVGGVGNIALDNLALDENGKFSYNGVVRIGKGSDANVDWLGPTLGDIPLEMNGQLYTYNNQKFLIAVIDIDMQESIQQTIHVTFGVNPVSSKTYTDDLRVSINGTTTDPQEATVMVGTLGNGNINFSLPDFVLSGGVYVGNIALENLEVDAEGKFSFNGTTRIAEGSNSNVNWLGPTLGDVPLAMKGQFYTYNGVERLIVTIDIDMTENSLNQMIHVTFGATPVSTEIVEGEVNVTVNGTQAEPVPATVALGKLANGNLNFVLKNFELSGMMVGNISLDNLELAQDGTFTYNGITRIGAGDLEGVPAENWIGPNLGNVPLDLVGQITSTTVTVNITIDMRDSELNQMIYVEFTANRATMTGDFDNSGLVDSTDLNALVNALKNGSTDTLYDVTGDGQVSLKDITTLVNIINGIE